MATTTYKVTGMSCGHCVNAVTSELTSLDGVPPSPLTWFLTACPWSP